MREAPGSIELPTSDALAAALGDDLWQAVGPHVDAALLAPVRELLQRPSKTLRARLLTQSAGLCRPSAGLRRDAALIARAASAIELLHAGSLIVDDIQDGSPTRRGGASVHQLYGLPGALCSGNWLYFWPMRLLRALDLPKDREDLALRLYQEALERAHCGQALDLKVKVDLLAQGDMRRVYEAVVDLKTGSITALAMALGVLVGGGEVAALTHVQEFGRRFGLALQYCDDLGNLTSVKDPEKRYEDLMQRKPSGVWAIIARVADASTYAEWRALATRLPDSLAETGEWLARQEIVARGKSLVRGELATALAELRLGLGDVVNEAAFDGFHMMIQELIDAY